MKLYTDSEFQKHTRDWRFAMFVLSCAKLVVFFIFLVFMMSNVNAYTTQETVAFNKLFTSANLTESQQLTIFEYLDNSNIIISNETELINNVEREIMDSLDDHRESTNDNFTLIFRALENLQAYTKNLTLKESEVDKINAQIKLIEATKKKEEVSSDDLLTEYLKALKGESEPKQTINFTISDYLKKSEFTEYKLEQKDKELLWSDIQNKPEFNYVSISQLESYAKRTTTNIIIFLLAALGLAIGNLYKMKKEEKEKFVSLVARLSILERALESKKEEDPKNKGRINL